MTNLFTKFTEWANITTVSQGGKIQSKLKMSEFFLQLLY